MSVKPEEAHPSSVKVSADLALFKCQLDVQPDFATSFGHQSL